MTVQMRKPLLLFGAMYALSPTLLGQTFQDGQGIIYAYSDDRGSCYVQGHSNDFSSTLVIPTVINGLPVTRIGDGAFFGCKSLTAVTLGDSIRNIGYGAFYGCSALEALTLPTALHQIESYAFAACSALSVIDLGPGLSSINEDAFSSCSALSTITIPSQIDSISFRAFADCTSLTAVSIGAGTHYIDNYAFAGCTRLSEFSVSSDNPTYHALDGALIQSYSNTLLSAARTSSLTIPQGIERIRESICYGAEELTNLILPDGITDIDLFAFADCSQLQTVTSYMLQPNPIDDAVFQTYDESFSPSQSTYTNATLYVPVGTRSTYETTDGWSKFRNIVEFDPMCIENTTPDGIRNQSPILYFSPDGYRRPHPVHGINIIQYEDGTVGKAFWTE